MEELVLIVEDTFLIQGRGLIVAGIKEENSIQLKVGSKVQIIRPNGTKIFSKVLGIEMVSIENFTERDTSKKVGILLENMKKEEIPERSAVFLIN